MTNQLRKMEPTCEMATAWNPKDVQVLAAGADDFAEDHRGTWKESVERAKGRDHRPVRCREVGLRLPNDTLKRVGNETE